MEVVETKTRDLPLEVQQILSASQHLKHLPDKNKVHCSLSGHEMSCDEKAISAYLSGKKCQRLKDLDENPSLSKYKEVLLESRKKFHKGQLFCLLTLKHINKLSEQIEKHTSGRKFQKAFKKWEECKKTGEKFVPFSRKQNKPQQRDDVKDNLDDSLKSSMDHEEDEGNASDDSLSDLYPDKAVSDDDMNGKEED